MLDDDAVIATEIGGRIELVPFDLYLDTHAALATKYRAAGLTHAALDLAITAALPMALASAIYGITWH